MARRLGFFVAAAMLVVGPAAAQDVEDVQAVLQAAADTMGVTDMMSIEYSGNGWVGRVGQNYAPDQDWPRFELAELHPHHRFRDELLDGARWSPGRATIPPAAGARPSWASGARR